MSVLVTGAAGFAGRYLLELLHRRGDAPLFGLVHRGPAPLLEGVCWLTADVGDVEALRRAVEAARPGVIYHLAAQASAAEDDREAMFRLNVDGTLNLLAAARSLGRPVRVMLASTGYVYGPCVLGRPATEDAPLNPGGVYTESKAEMERRALDVDWGADVVIAIARAFNHTGPRQEPRFAIPAFARQLAAIEAGQAEPVLRVGNLDTWRDISDVRDVVRAYASLMETSGHGERFNVCTGRAVRMADVLSAMVAMSRARVEVVQDPRLMRPVDLPINYGSPRKLGSRTGWQPEFSLAQTLGDTLKWWRRSACPS